MMLLVYRVKNEQILNLTLWLLELQMYGYLSSIFVVDRLFVIPMLIYNNQAIVKVGSILFMLELAIVTNCTFAFQFIVMHHIWATTFTCLCDRKTMWSTFDILPDVLLFIGNVLCLQ